MQPQIREAVGWMVYECELYIILAWDRDAQTLTLTGGDLASAGLAIRSKTRLNRVDQLKEIIRAWGENPEELLTKDALSRGNISETSEENQNHSLTFLAEQLKQLIKKEVSE